MHSYIVWLSPYNSVEDQVRSEPITHSLFDGTVHQVATFNCFQVTHHPQWYRTHRVFIWKQSTPMVNSRVFIWKQSTPMVNSRVFIWKQSTPMVNSRVFIWKQAIVIMIATLHLKTIHSANDCTSSSENNPLILNAHTLHLKTIQGDTECTLFIQKQSTVIVNSHSSSKNNPQWYWMHRFFILEQFSDTECMYSSSEKCTDSLSENNPEILNAHSSQW